MYCIQCVLYVLYPIDSSEDRGYEESGNVFSSAAIQEGCFCHRWLKVRMMFQILFPFSYNVSIWNWEIFRFSKFHLQDTARVTSRCVSLLMCSSVVLDLEASTQRS